MRRLIPPLHEAMKALLPLWTRTPAPSTRTWPRVGHAEGHGRRSSGRAHDAMQAGCKAAVEVPLAVMRLADGCWEAMVEMARARQLRVALRPRGGRQGARGRGLGRLAQRAINLPGIEDEAFRRATGEEAERLAARAAAMRDAVLSTLAARKD